VLIKEHSVLTMKVILVRLLSKENFYVHTTVF